jgi:hypothetical protein
MSFLFYESTYKIRQERCMVIIIKANLNEIYLKSHLTYTIVE